MTYLQKNNKKKGRNNKKIIAGLIIFLIFIFAFVFNDFSSNLVHRGLLPLKKTTDYVFSPFKNITTYFSSKNQLAKDNFLLSEENKSLKIDFLKVESLENENQNLRSLLNIIDNRATTIGEVILTPPFSPYDTLVIFSEKEISIGDFVFYKNILIGEVVESHSNNYVIRLYSSPDQKIPIKINNEITAEAEGQGGLGFKIQIPKDIEIKKGDLIYSMTETNSVIGIVEDIEFMDSNSFQVIRFQYPFNLNKMSFVEVKTPKYSDQ